MLEKITENTLYHKKNKYLEALIIELILSILENIWKKSKATEKEAER